MARKIRYGIAISQEILGEGAPVPFQGGIAEGMAKAAAMGFDCVELHIRNPLSFDAKALVRISHETGVRIAAIGTGLEYGKNGLSLTSDDPAIRAQALQRMREHIDLAAHFGAVVFLGLIRGNAASERDTLNIWIVLRSSLFPSQPMRPKRRCLPGWSRLPIIFRTCSIRPTKRSIFLRAPALNQ